MKARIFCSDEISSFRMERISQFIKTDNENAEYHVLLHNIDGFSIVGFVSVDNHYCIVDLNNEGVNAAIFLNWLHERVKLYPNLYCIPNSKGALIWSALGFKSVHIYLRPSFKKIFSKWHKRFIKFGFINMFFELSTTGGIRIDKQLFYSESIPKKIWLDTF